MENWKVEEHEMPRWNYLADKIDQLAADPKNCPKMTTEETIEFLQIWERRQFDINGLACDKAWVNYVKKCLNEGDDDILYK